MENSVDRLFYLRRLGGSFLPESTIDTTCAKRSSFSAHAMAVNVSNELVPKLFPLVYLHCEPSRTEWSVKFPQLTCPKWVCMCGNLFNANTCDSFAYELFFSKKGKINIFFHTTIPNEHFLFFS